MTVRLTPDVWSDTLRRQHVVPPIITRRIDGHITLTPLVHNQRELLVALSKALQDPRVRGDLLLVRTLPVRSIDRAQALDRLVDHLDVADALTWCISTADADQLARALDRAIS